MPESRPLKPSWNAGELNPRLAARTDFEKYRNGAEVLENMIPLSEGGVMRRAGTRYVAGTKDGTVKSRLKPFKFSTTQSYMLEMGDQYFRVFKDQGQVTVGATDAAVTNGDFDSDIASWNDISAGGGSLAWSSSNTSMEFILTSSSDTASADQSISVSSSLIANEHLIEFEVDGVAGDGLQFAIGTSSSATDVLSAVTYKVGYHSIPFTPNSTVFWLQYDFIGSNKVIDVALATPRSYCYLDNVKIASDEVFDLETPWGSSQLYELEGPQSADTLYMFHNNTPTHKLTRAGHTQWSLERVFYQDGPYFDTNITGTTLTAESTHGRNMLLTASAVTGINANNGFGSSDIGRCIRLTSSATTDWGWAVVTASTSTTTVRVNVVRNYNSTQATTEWRLGSFCNETGWPGVGTFHQQRLIPARTIDEPQTFFPSQTADFENFSVDSPTSSGAWDGTIEDDDALKYTLSSDDVEAIEWLSAGVKMQIGTRGAEWEATSDGPVIKPTDVQLNRHTKHGSARIQPLRIGPAIVFAQRAKRRIRELAFNFEQDGLVAPDLTRLSQHVTLGGIVEMAYQQEPESIVWMPRTDGQLLSMTYRREEDVVAWARHIVGGSYGSGDAVVESVATIPGSTASGQTQDSDDRDEVWLQVKRTINGSTVRYIEFMERDFETGDSQEDSYYIDSLVTYDSSAALSISGATHLAAETAKVLANGAIQSDVTVGSTGDVTLTHASSTVQIGLGYTHRMKTFKLEAGAAEGTAVGRTGRISGVTSVFLNSLTQRLGASSSQLTVTDFRNVSDLMDTASPLYTGEYFQEIEQDWQTDPRIVIESDDPAPYTLLALVPEVKKNR